MPTPTFDGINLLVVLPVTSPVIDVRQDLYSEWKLWVLTGTNAKFPQLFTTEGGQPTEGIEVLGRAYFLRNDVGWRIRPAEEDADVVFNGNLFRTAATLPLFVPTLGGFTVATRIKFSNLALVELVSGTGSSEAHIACAYDQTITDLRMSIWAERLGATVVSPISCQVDWFNPNGTLLFMQTDSLPDASGVFNLTRTESLAANNAYYAKVQVTDSQGTLTTLRGVPTGP